MTDAISANDDGVKLKPEIMEKEKLYHCICLLYTSDAADE